MKIKLYLLFFFMFGCATYKVGELDQFKSFSELESKTQKNIDYEIRTQNTNSKNLVTAFHGGLIEPGTTELAYEIAQDDLDLYTFIGLKKGLLHEASMTSSSMHITSSRFDEPVHEKMIKESNFCVGLHGFGGREADFCIGGGNAHARKELVKKLSKDFPELKSCELCCPPLNGVSLKNPINKCKFQGVQVEISPKARNLILKDKTLKTKLGKTFRSYIIELGY